MDLISYLPKVKRYLSFITPEQMPTWRSQTPASITPLAQGEYNMNYLIQQGDSPPWVLRVNVGSQIHREDQIEYEFKALQLLAETKRTPLPFFVDDSREHIPQGVLGMQYLPGTMMNYQTHATEAAQLFAEIHSLSHDLERTHLIQEKTPLSMTYEECTELLPGYLESDLADPDIVSFLKEVLDWANTARLKETYFLNDPWNCIINTEVNSSNFIWCECEKRLSLVDWEKPLWGDPSQDLSHFCVPTTTLWKTNFRMDESIKQVFLVTYCDHLNDKHLIDTIHDRVRLRDPFNCLRGISWSAWAWIAYQTGGAAIKNQDTYRKLCSYMEIHFIRSLFKPYMEGGYSAG
ncbi:MAG: aminoglycoside phosphotransferase family protein [Anaerolineae bacterium]|jgi:thiamine kinase-like enzyme|nr:aminoglycoside phosphotransferase family protein [Anaerolineae bacterium]